MSQKLKYTKLILKYIYLILQNKIKYLIIICCEINFQGHNDMVLGGGSRPLLLNRVKVKNI